jgi:hypothetical protein
MNNIFNLKCETKKCLQTSWATYRPHLYFGLKTKRPRSPVFGVLWFEQPRTPHIQSLPLRHWCNQSEFSPKKKLQRKFSFQIFFMSKFVKIWI